MDKRHLVKCEENKWKEKAERRLIDFSDFVLKKILYETSTIFSLILTIKKTCISHIYVATYFNVHAVHIFRF